MTDKLIPESLAIIGIVLIISFVFLRAKNKNYALSVLPLCFVPVANVFSWLVGYKFLGIFGFSHQTITIIIDILALIVSSAMYFSFSYKIESVKSRRAFIVMCCVFSFLLTVIYISNIIKIG